MGQEGTGTISINCNRKVCDHIVGFLNACASILYLKWTGVLMSRSFIVDGIQLPLWTVACLTCFQNVGD